MKATIGLTLIFQLSASFRTEPSFLNRRTQNSFRRSHRSNGRNIIIYGGCKSITKDPSPRIQLELRSSYSSHQVNSTPQKSQSSSQSKKEKTPKPKNTKPNSRTVAIHALAEAAASTYQACSSDGAGAEVSAPSFASRELEQDENYKLLEARDRSFAKLLVATVERRLGQIDKVLGCCIEKYPPKKGKHSHLIQATLRTGVAQLLFLQTPPFAALKETVQVLRIYHRATPSTNPPVPEPMIKFVNGVLRKLARPAEGAEGGEEDPVLESFGMTLLKEKTSPEDNIAPWLIKKWKMDWGEDVAGKICEQMMPMDESSVVPRIDLSTKYAYACDDEDKVVKMQQLLSELGEDAVLLPHGSIRVGPSLKGGVKNWPGYDGGTWWVQDASSTLPALTLISALRDKYQDLSNVNVVDMCSAPGGKTSQLLSSGFAHVTAIEANPRRSRRLIENLERLQLIDKCKVVVTEGQNWISPENNPVVHGILVDVPCSATGTGGRRPDVLRRTSDLSDLLQIQETLANHCVDNILDVGGIMVYATCSILKEESETQVEKLIARGGIQTMPIAPHEVPGYEGAIDDHGWLRVLPGVLEGELGSTDGFFVARLVKTG